MQFCSVGAKNIEAKKFDALAHGIVLDSDFTQQIADYDSLYDAVKSARTFVDGFTKATRTFKTSPIAGVKNNKLYLAISTGMADSLSESATSGASFGRVYPADNSRTIDPQTFCMRYLTLHDQSNGTGTFDSDISSALDFPPENTQKLGENYWNGLTPRLIVFPDVDTDDTVLAVDKINSGSVSLYNSRDQSIYRYIGNGYHGLAHVDMDTGNYTFTFKTSYMTFTQGKNNIGTFKRKSVSVFQGLNSDANGALVTNWRWSYTTYRNNQGNTNYYSGEGGVHPFYVAKTAPDDSAKTISTIAGGFGYNGMMNLLVLKAGEDFDAASGVPTEVLSIPLTSAANLFDYYSIKI